MNKTELTTLTESELNYLKKLNLNAFSDDPIYFDYETIIKYIDKTPHELDRMPAGFLRDTLLWFEDFFKDTLEYLLSEDTYSALTSDKDVYDKRCPVNDKESNEYQKYITYRKIFALSIKAIVEGKADEIRKKLSPKQKISVTYTNGHLVKPNPSVYFRDSKDSFATDLRNLAGNCLTEEAPYKYIIYLDKGLECYSIVQKADKVPSTSVEEAMIAIAKATHEETAASLTDQEKSIITFICQMLKLDNINDIFDELEYNTEYYSIMIMYIIQAMEDKANGHNFKECYESALSKKTSLSDPFINYFDNKYGDNAKMATAQLEKNLLSQLSSLNNTNGFANNIFLNSGSYSRLIDANGVSDEIVNQNNSKRFEEMYDNKSRKIAYKVVDANGKEIDEISRSVTASDRKEDIESLKKEEKQEQAKLKEIDVLIDLITKKLKKETLTPAQMAKLEKIGLTATSEETAYKDKKVELEADKVISSNNLATFGKAKTILTKKKAKKKNNEGKINKSQALLKYAKKMLPRMAGSALGAASGYQLAFVLGPAFIVAVNIVSVILITQARAYANKLEQERLQQTSLEIESIEKPANKITKKINHLLRKINLGKIADFNLFEAIANNSFTSKRHPKLSKINDIFSNPAFIRFVASFLTAQLVALDAVAIKRAIKKHNNVQKEEFDSSTKQEEKEVTEDPTDDSEIIDDSATQDTISMKVGDNLGTDDSIIYGYKTSYDAKLGTNPVHLNQSIINDGQTLAKNVYYYNENGQMVKLNLKANDDILEAVRNAGLDFRDVVISYTDRVSGEGRFFTTITDAARSKGLILKP